jgi:general secretion pathway protein G
MHRPVLKPQRNDEAMTLVEVMVVVAIIGLIMGAVAFEVRRRLIQARIRMTQTKIVRTKEAIALYDLEAGPGCPQSLQALVDERILENEPLDAWGEPLLFRCPAEQGRGVADVWSKGPDGRDGTEDDVCSWKLGRRRRRERSARN